MKHHTVREVEGVKHRRCPLPKEYVVGYEKFRFIPIGCTGLEEWEN